MLDRLKSVVSFLARSPTRRALVGLIVGAGAIVWHIEVPSNTVADALFLVTSAAMALLHMPAPVADDD